MNSRCFKFHRYITPLPLCQMSANFPGVEFLKTTSIACRRPLPPQTRKNQKEKAGRGGGGREREESISPICFRGGLVCTQATHRRSAKEQEKHRPFTSSTKRQVSLSCSDGKNVPASVMHEQFFYVSAAVALAVAVVVRLSFLKPEEK